MVKNKIKLRKVLLLGSGALKIGEAGEFDYSGSQAAKALKEENIETVLINPNIATIQTSNNFAQKIYYLPVDPYFVKKVIITEKPDGILLGFGGQTALNCGLSLAKSGIFKKYKVQVLGTPISAIEKTEDRLLFRNFITRLGLKVPRSNVCSKLSDVLRLKNKIKLPVLVRSGFSLGGLGSGVARNNQELIDICQKALNVSSQILIEEYLDNWKELEYEVVRDQDDNAITVCNMENFDPMGIHTGESIVVAPSQTLNNVEYHSLRSIAIKIVKELPIIGECNIQYALNPKSGDYRIIELNARLSRSSALASKATGYPLAYVAAKLALGYRLSEITNKVTQATCAFFEPALDYIVVKIPRWDFLKFKHMDDLIGSEMQSVGEVMAIGRSFEEALQKAVRSLDLDYEGIISDDLDKKRLSSSLSKDVIYKDLKPTPERLYNIAFNLFYGQSIEEISSLTGIDIWFIKRIASIIDTYKKMLIDAKKNKNISNQLLNVAKKSGFSDRQIGEIYDISTDYIRNLRKKWQILPKVCQIDTLAGEFPAKTNYLYFSYHRTQHDIKPTNYQPVGILGGGPYQIGSSVEFDWCAVNCVVTAKKLGYTTIMINNNPETVSTDYDISDRLYFEELSLERILDIVDFEKCPLIVSVGGQTPNTLVPKLAIARVKILGTSPISVERAEDRNKFSALLDKLNIKQPIWRKFSTKKDALKFAQKIGYPVLLRPSFVLSGRAMFEAYSNEDLNSYFSLIKNSVKPEYPLVVSKFIRGAKEIDFDAVSDQGMIRIYAISEHIEHAGVHSGDATLVLPTFSLSTTSKKIIYDISSQISQNLQIHGPFNIQYLVNDYATDKPKVMVIEANLRASRSFPFVSKTYGINFISSATKIMLGKKISPIDRQKLNFFSVKVPRFSFTRLRKVDPILRIEMASTGEVASFGEDLHEAYLKSILSTGISYPHKSVLLSLGGIDIKNRFLPAAKILSEMKFSIFATKNTQDFLKYHSINSNFLYKVYEGKNPSVIDAITQKKVSFVVNISERSDLSMSSFKYALTDGYLIRRATVDAKIPLFTKVSIATLFIESLKRYNLDNLKIRSWEKYIQPI